MHKEHLDRKKIKAVNFITMLMGFSQAVLTYIMSTYFKEASGTENVGLFYFASYTILLIILLNLHKMVRVLGKANVFLFAVFSKVVFIALLSNMNASVLGIWILMAYVISAGLEWVAMDAILETYSTDGESGRIRGKHLMILNAGFMLGPFLSTMLLDRFGFHGVFVFLLIFNSVLFVLALLKLRDSNERFEKKVRVAEIIRKVAKRKNILRIYHISFVLELFYALTIIYVPIYLFNLGFGWEQIGIVLTVMLIPFVIVQYPAGILADKKWGEKEMLAGSIALIGVTTLLIYFTHSKSVLVWSLILFGTRVGAALVEVLRDSYFYKRIDGRDVDLINFFRTSMPLAFIVSSFFSFIIIYFFSIRAIFPFIALVVFSALFSALMLKDNKSACEC